jgi:hypothetical protein
MTDDEQAKLPVGVRLSLVERDMMRILVAVRSLEDRVTELNGVAKGLRLASLLIGIVLGIFTLVQILRPMPL